MIKIISILTEISIIIVSIYFIIEITGRVPDYLWGILIGCCVVFIVWDYVETRDHIRRKGGKNETE